VSAFNDSPNADFHLIADGAMVMAMRIRVTTGADLFEERQRQHIERGYRIEEERPIPVDGLCSFIAVSDIPALEELGNFVAKVLTRSHGSTCEL
jgi:hypothetical protein